MVMAKVMITIISINDNENGNDDDNDDSFPCVHKAHEYWHVKSKMQFYSDA